MWTLHKFRFIKKSSISKLVSEYLKSSNGIWQYKATLVLKGLKHKRGQNTWFLEIEMKKNNMLTEFAKIYFQWRLEFVQTDEMFSCFTCLKKNFFLTLEKRTGYSHMPNIKMSNYAMWTENRSTHTHTHKYLILLYQTPFTQAQMEIISLWYQL